MEEKTLTSTQKLFDERYREMIGNLLTIVEAVVPQSPNDRQWLNVRKMLNTTLHNAREDFLDRFVK